MGHDITGIHHVTALCGPPQENLEFYTRLLGMRLVKKTVNFDNPEAYHFYYGDRIGRPGTLVTFFPHPGWRPGVAGAHEVAITHLAIPAGSLGYWADRLGAAGVEVNRQAAGGQERLSLRDPSGMRLTLCETPAVAEPQPQRSDIPPQRAITGIAAVTTVVKQLEPTAVFLTETLGFRMIGRAGARAWFEPGAGSSGQSIEVIENQSAPRAVLGAGSVHHVAWRVPDDDARERVRALIDGKVTGLTELRDRNYFRSIYFREPGGVIFEIATDGPGFLVDEDESSLGTALKLPPQFEARRAEIEAALPPLEKTS